MLNMVLLKVFPDFEPDTINESAGCMCEDFWVLPGKQGPRWVIPCNARLGLPVLRQWRPYSFTSLAKWQGLLWLYSSRLLGYVPGVKTISINVTGIASPYMEEYIPVVYIGTPGPQQKAVVTLVDHSTGRAQSVLKVALGEHAVSSLQREAQALETLADQTGVGAPTLLWIDPEMGSSCQSVVPGKLTGRALRQSHIDWLTNLPRNGQITTLNQRCKTLGKAFKDCRPDEAVLIAQALKKITGTEPIPEILVHGDFAPWNLKSQSYGKIVAIDWEEARPNGLPLHDLCHFFSIQAHLFGGCDVLSNLNKSLLVVNYWKALRIRPSSLRPLYLHYLLTMVAGLDGDCSNEYRIYLFNQIREMVNP
jgi:hypothetical protein